MAVFERGPQGPAGPPGKSGRQLYSGSGAPSNALGKDGDFYIDTTGEILWGPKASGAWTDNIALGGGGASAPFQLGPGTEYPTGGTLSNVGANFETITLLSGKSQGYSIEVPGVRWGGQGASLPGMWSFGSTAGYTTVTGQEVYIKTTTGPIIIAGGIPGGLTNGGVQIGDGSQATNFAFSGWGANFTGFGGINAGVTYWGRTTGGTPTNPNEGLFKYWKTGSHGSTDIVEWIQFPNGTFKKIGPHSSSHVQTGSGGIAGKQQIYTLTDVQQSAAAGQIAFTRAIYAMPNEVSATIDFDIQMARRTNVTKAGNYRGKATYRRTGGGAPTLVGAIVYQTEQETTAGDTVAFVVSGNNIEARPTAADSDSRNWSIEMRVHELDAV